MVVGVTYEGFGRRDKKGRNLNLEMIDVKNNKT